MKQIVSILAVALLLAGAATAFADDTAVYGAGTINVKPNVLIVFDTSGSMSTVDVPSVYYDPAKTYSGTYTSTTVYRRQWYWGSGWSTTTFASSVGDLNCSAASDALSTDGNVSIRIRDSSSGYTCGGWGTKDLYTGNYLNYNEDPSLVTKSRIDVAKEVVTNLLNSTANVNFGLMTFEPNGENGGKLTTNGAIGSAPADLVADVAGLSANGKTPLAETLAEAGLYFAGKNSWYGNGTYTSPIQYRCQKNYVIFMTDGDPTSDDDSRLNDTDYINNKRIGDYDKDGDTGTSQRLDDVAAFLYDNDLSTLGTGDSQFEKQNVITYTIGFKSDQQLLQNTADRSGVDYYRADSISSLKAAFSKILSSIDEVNGVFVSPVVPISRMNRVFAGNYLYIGFFKPQVDGRWLGNVKKYGLNSTGDLIDADGNPATDANGQILDTARSYWVDPSNGSDGANVDKGGVGGLLLDRTSRDIYTYTGTVTDLTASSNAFTTTNTVLTPTVMGVTTTTEKNDIITDLHGIGKDWIMGDVLHSVPNLVHYDTNSDGKLDSNDDAMIFVGTNGGLMHCFKDSDGSEVWGFVPYEQLGRLKNLTDSVSDHDYFSDGQPVVYEKGLTEKTLIYGERRGSSYYYALDVSNYAAPKWKYKIGPDILGATSEQLGQSWGRPQIVKLATGSTTSVDAVLLPGGYDDNQDADVPATNDTMGRAVFSVAVSSGALSVLNYNATTTPIIGMNNCIVDLVGIDPDNDGITNRVYAPDLGGNVFAFEDDNKDASWSGRKLFSASALDSVQRKIFYAPDAVKTADGEMIFFGTGDRADPEETGVVNRFYAVKNDWTSSASFSTMDESDLFDATDDKLQLGTATERANAQAELLAKHGWFIQLENTGEKMINAPIVFGGVVYFTTYEPDTSASSSTDPCDVVGGRGTARLYALDYKTGNSVSDFSIIIEQNGDNEVVERGKKDRSKIIGTSIPSAPVIAILEGGVKMYVGVEGGVTDEDPVATYNMNMYYWRQLLN